MKKTSPINSIARFKLLGAIGLGLWFPPLLQADVVVLQNGGVLTGTVLQQDGTGVLIQTDTGTYRYPPSWISDVKKETAAAPHVSNNGQNIPDWAQIVSLLANNQWAYGMRQVPATMIETGPWKNVPYVSFVCADGGYEMNIFGDLNHPAAIQIGAMSFLHDNGGAKSNCVNFICSVLANATDRKMVRTLNFDQKDVQKERGMTFQTVLPGEYGSYGGWWVSVRNDDALANAQASEAELMAITQPRTVAAPPAVPPPAPAPVQPAATTANAVAPPDAGTSQSAAAPAQPVTTTTTQSGMITTYGATYGAYPGWTAEELAAAHPVAPAPYPSATGAYSSAAAAKTYPAATAAADDQAHPAAASDKVYPRTYDRSAGTYDLHRR